MLPQDGNPDRRFMEVYRMLAMLRGGASSIALGGGVISGNIENSVVTALATESLGLLASVGQLGIKRSLVFKASGLWYGGLKGLFAVSTLLRMTGIVLASISISRKNDYAVDTLARSLGGIALIAFSSTALLDSVVSKLIKVSPDEGERLLENQGNNADNAANADGEGNANAANADGEGNAANAVMG